MPRRIDLRPLLADGDAAEMLLLARGQLNRAFTAHGLASPDPVPHGPSQLAGDADRDDPAGHGRTQAAAAFGPAFDAWCESMPARLVAPVLQILLQTEAALAAAGDNPAARGAVTTARHFLRLQAARPDARDA